ncbi:tetratricopeptide repeat protein [Pullulanibacillus sp. KACC 23026]|uniref:tetratricopeptide repeat protein n=1 Tax=Pullulanibacillus sp. KACC 23026 TaxID=3028315 RepID=UPI0023B18AF7|nr:tetratricopeptide repeat protein [Pullulanibacillus sp. KACC 23026]WEG11162.1 tetratricopeptide repeat protein [Pullulanibacillus sp. KACC 23026]
MKRKNRPRVSDLINELAIASMESRQYEAALEQFQKAAQLKPSTQSLTNLAYFYYNEGVPTGDGAWEIKEQEAIQLLESVIQRKPRSHFPYSLLGQIYITEKQFDKATAVLLQAVSLKPIQPNLNNLGVCYYNQHRWSEAADCFKKAHLKRNRGDSLSPLLSYGVCLAKLGFYENARDTANQLLLYNQELKDDSIENIEDEIAYIFYMLDDYKRFAEIYSKLNLNHYAVEWFPPYFYALWKSEGTRNLENVSDDLIRHKKEEFQEALQDDDDNWEPGRRLEYMDEIQQDIDFIKTHVDRIKSGVRPELDYEPPIETGCYLFGCRRHNHPTYTDD